MYNEAIKNNILDKNIASLLENSKNKTQEKNNTIFSNELIKETRISANTSNNSRMVKMADMTLIMLYTEMRAGEIRIIESDVTFTNNFIEFRNLLKFNHNRHETRHTFITHLKN